MAGENSGKKPEKPGGVGLEKDPPESVEAEPRSKRMAYICWNDGASNFVEPGWESFKAFMETFIPFEGLDLSGLSITIPHKENALRYLKEKGAEVEELAE